VYRRIRKPMPPPERVEPDRRLEADERDAEQEIRDALAGVAPLPPPRDPPSAGHGLFADRAQAGDELAEALRGERGSDAVLLAIPRGGVEVAAVMADRMELPLDIVVPRKLGAPQNPELGLGAIAEGVRVLDERLIRTLGVPDAYLAGEIARQEAEIRRRTDAYREGRAPVPVTERTAIVVDDGVATGGTAIAAVRWARGAGAREVVFAAPVAPREAVELLRAEADRVVILWTPPRFHAVGQWYVEFSQVDDERVIELLRGAAARHR
jgi:predicted phosphoribosyltransferase